MFWQEWVLRHRVQALRSWSAVAPGGPWRAAKRNGAKSEHAECPPVTCVILDSRALSNPLIFLPRRSFYKIPARESRPWRRGRRTLSRPRRHAGSVSRLHRGKCPARCAPKRNRAASLLALPNIPEGLYVIPKRGLHTALYAGAPAPYWAPPAPFPSEPPIPLAFPRGPSRPRDAAPMARCASSASATQSCTGSRCSANGIHSRADHDVWSYCHHVSFRPATLATPASAAPPPPRSLRRTPRRAAPPLTWHFPSASVYCPLTASTVGPAPCAPHQPPHPCAPPTHHGGPEVHRMCRICRDR